MNSELLGQTWDQLAGKHHEVIQSFYDRLFQYYPHYQVLFSESLDRQREKMLETMAFIARISDETEVTHPKMVKLGERHNQFQLTVEDLERFKTVFIEILSEYCGQSWTQDHYQAWMDVFDQRVIPKMSEGLKSQKSPLEQELKSISDRISIRNQLFGTIIRIKPRVYEGEVILSLKGGDEIHAVPTLSSIQRLDLTEGSQVYILIRAPHLILVNPNCNLRFSAGNYLTGKVINIIHARLTAEITLELKGGDWLRVLVPQTAINELGIKEGETFGCVFKAGDVILAVEEK